MNNKLPATVMDILRNAAASFADRPAYWTTSGTGNFLTFSEVYADACALSQYLIADGFSKGESVCLFAPNRYEWAIAFWGVILAGGVVIPLDSNSGPAEIRHTLQDTGCSWIVVTRGLLKKLVGFRDKSIIVLDGADDGNYRSMSGILKSQKAKDPNVDVSPDQPMAVIYTSGTTSRPKGVVLSHSGVIASVSGIAKTIPFSSDDRLLSTVSLSHTLELTCGLILPFLFGGSVVYSPGLRYTSIFRCATKFKPTILFSVPRVFQMLLENAIHRVAGVRCMSVGELEKEGAESKRLKKKVHAVFGGNSRYFISGGAPLATTIVNGYKEIGITLLQCYGLTETSGVSTLTPPDGFIQGSVGRALPETEIKIEKKDKNGIGEICIAGKNLMSGYHNNSEATKKMIRGGWLHSGDLGHMDKDGNLFITGRSKNVIVTSAGVNIFPEELEKRIIQSPFIQEACVVGKEMPDHTETVFAVIVVNEDNLNRYMEDKKAQGGKPPVLSDLIWRELEKYTADLATYKRIQDFRIRSRKLPHGRTNKIIRDKVKKESFSMLGRTGRLNLCDEKERPLAFVNATIITPFRVAHSICLIIEGGKITQLGTGDSVYLPAHAQVIDLEHRYLMPGFIDLHVHGGGGFDFTSSNEQQIASALDYYISHGITKLLPTVYVEEEKKYLQTIRDLAAMSKKHERHGALYGIHLEGPFVNREMRGALNEEYIWPGTIDNLFKLLKAGDGAVKLMTLAPEIPGALDIMQVSSQEGVALAVGHSCASFEEIEVAIDQGLSQVTHIFNAMPQLHHRHPGVLIAAFLKQELKVHLIADGFHVHPATVNLLYKLKGAGGIIMISDAISASGCKDGSYSLSGQPVTVKSGKAYLKNGSLAGSTVTLDQSLKYVVENTAIPLQEAVRMVTLNPARVLGLDHKKGILAVGKDADIVVMDKDFSIYMTLLDGTIVYQREQQGNAV